jgi:hypothetical protein
MSFEVYYSTRDPEALAIHDKVMAAKLAWQEDALKVVNDLGFGAYRTADFGIVYGFLLKCEAGDKRYTGPEIEGFKGGKRVGGLGAQWFEYSIHGKHAKTKDLHTIVGDLHERHAQPESSQGFGVRTAEGIVCDRLSVMAQCLNGNRLAVSQLWMMDDREICIQVPVEKKKGVWILPQLSGIWTELTTSQMVERFNRHNAAVASGAETESEFEFEDDSE